jgi:hypothetical protein
MAEITRCSLCHDAALAVLLDLGAQPLAERDDGHRYPLALLRCRRCGLAQLSYEVTRTEVFPPEHPYSSGNSAALRSHFAALADRLAAGLVPGEVVVDIGANDGTLLAAYPTSLTRVAVEPTGQARKIPSGIHVYQDFFDPVLAVKIFTEHGWARRVTAANVLAHVSDPHEFVEAVRILLAPDGLFVVEVHDLASITEGLQFDTIYHEHLRFFTAATLCRLLEDHDLVVGACEPIPTHGGSLRVTASPARGELARRARDAVAMLRAVLAASPGPLYGVGATTRATPLIHYAGLEPWLSCVVEVTGSDKIGQSIPGTLIPIVDEGRLIVDQPPTALLLSWHLESVIVPNLRRRGYRGRIVVPLPEPRVLDG